MVMLYAKREKNHPQDAQPAQMSEMGRYVQAYTVSPQKLP
jgi:hypothetical protein